MSRNAKFLKNLQRFRLVTFDVTDTILRFRKPPSEQYVETAAMLGVTNIDQGHLSQCFRNEFKNMAKNYPNFGSGIPNMNWQKWWTRLVENIFLCVKPGISTEQLEELTETLIRIYRTEECWEHVGGAIDLVNKVKNSGKCVGVISNFDPSLRQVLGSMGIADRFDFILTSYDAGVQKPNADIFKIPLKEYNVQPEEALHIGNLYEIDYLGAKKAGWSSLLVGNESAQSADAIDKRHIHASIKELTNALETQTIDW